MGQRFFWTALERDVKRLFSYDLNREHDPYLSFIDILTLECNSNVYTNVVQKFWKDCRCECCYWSVTWVWRHALEIVTWMESIKRDNDKPVALLFVIMGRKNISCAGTPLTDRQHYRHHGPHPVRGSFDIVFTIFRDCDPYAYVWKGWCW